MDPISIRFILLFLIRLSGKIINAPDKVQKILTTYKSGLTLEETAGEFDISPGIVRRLLLRNDVPANKYRNIVQANILPDLGKYSLEQLKTLPLEKLYPTGLKQWSVQERSTMNLYLSIYLI